VPSVLLCGVPSSATLLVGLSRVAPLCFHSAPISRDHPSLLAGGRGLSTPGITATRFFTSRVAWACRRLWPQGLIRKAARAPPESTEGYQSPHTYHHDRLAWLTPTRPRAEKQMNAASIPAHSPGRGSNHLKINRLFF
jgi:hypothetical protein